MPIHEACRKGCSEEIIAVLINHGCKLDARDKVNNLFWKKEKAFIFEEQTKGTPLHVAAATGRNNLISYLLDQGAEIDAKDALGRTALHFACMPQTSGKAGDGKKGASSVDGAAWGAARTLVERGASVNIKDKVRNYSA